MNAEKKELNNEDEPVVSSGASAEKSAKPSVKNASGASAEAAKPSVKNASGAAEKVAKPAEKSAKPAEKSAAEKVAKPAEKSAKPAEKSAAEKVAKPAEKVAKPAEKAAKPATEKVAKPAEKSAKPAEKSAAEKVAKPAEKSAAEKVAKPVEKSAKKVAKPAAEKVAKPATNDAGNSGVGGVHVAGYEVSDASPVENGMLRGSAGHYSAAVAPALIKRFGYKTPMQLPRIVKVVLNVGLGEAKNNRAVLTDGVAALTKLSGQRAVPTKAKNSIAGFKIREEMPIGAMVTLRGARMHDFFVRLVHVALPRVKDFHGLPRKGFDGRGNFTLGIKDASVFPELAGAYGTKAPGISVSFVTTARTNKEAEEMFLLMGMPFMLPKVKKAS